MRDVIEILSEGWDVLSRKGGVFTLLNQWSESFGHRLVQFLVQFFKQIVCYIRHKRVYTLINDSGTWFKSELLSLYR